jgi:hypothetical protein
MILVVISFKTELSIHDNTILLHIVQARLEEGEDSKDWSNEPSINPILFFVVRAMNIDLLHVWNSCISMAEIQE